MAQQLIPIIGDQAWPIARTLVGTFGSVAAALDARPARLRTALQANEELVAIIVGMRALFREAARECLDEKVVRVDCPSLQAHVLAALSPADEERFLVIYAGARQNFISQSCETIHSGVRVLADTRTLFDRALELGARSILLAHNHPSGIASPSQSDIEATKRIEFVASSLDIHVIDHLITAGKSLFSMRKGVLL